VQQSTYNFEKSNPEVLHTLFRLAEEEARKLLDESLVLPAYEQILKCSHAFNLLDARGVLGRDERMDNILKISKLSERVAKSYLEQRIKLGFPLLPEAEREAAVKLYSDKFLQPKEGKKTAR
jgi:glycyl-tRNA synthetase alpha chain